MTQRISLALFGPSTKPFAFWYLDPASIYYPVFELHSASCLVDPALGTTPRALNHGVVVNPGEEVLLQVVEDATGLDLIHAEPVVERLLGHAAVLELGEEDLAVLGEEGARGVAIVKGLGLLALESAE